MSNRVGKPTKQIYLDGNWYWLVPYHIDNQGEIAYMLKPATPIAPEVEE